MAKKALLIDSITTDALLQTRTRMDEAVIEDYAEVWQANPEDNPFPPVLTYFDGNYYWLSDGHYRLTSAKQAGRRVIEAVVERGTRRDAILAALGANEDHGVRLTTADRRNKVRRALEDEEWRKQTDNWIAKQCKVSNKTVAAVRKEMEDSGQIERVEERQTANGRTVKPRQQKKLVEDSPLTEPAQTGSETEAKRNSETETKPKPEPIPVGNSQLDSEDDWSDLPEEPPRTGSQTEAKRNSESAVNKTAVKEAIVHHRQLLKRLNQVGLLEEFNAPMAALGKRLKEMEDSL